MAPEFETLLVVGEKESHEHSADYLTEQLGVEPLVIPEMGRSINPINDYKAYRKLKSIIKEFKPDIVHTHAAKPGALGRLAAYTSGVKVIVHTYHGHIFHSYFSSFRTNTFLHIERYMAKISSSLVAISPLQKKELVDDFKVAPADKFSIIPLGLDLDKFQIDFWEKRTSFRNEFLLSEDTIAISIIGRLVPVKNHHLFIEAVAHVFNNTSKNIKAFIIGDGEMRSSLEQYATGLGLTVSLPGDNNPNANLVFTSWRSDVDIINAGSDIIALTSLNEGTPVSLIEAQAAHKPIVSTRVGGIQDIVQEGKTALLSDIDDKTAFYNNLLKIVDDDNLRNEMSQQGKVNVATKYSYQNLINNMSHLYYNLLQNAPVKSLARV
ncbi:MAG: glycosyltransferase [Ginsengibacter sp.]